MILYITTIITIYIIIIIIAIVWQRPSKTARSAAAEPGRSRRCARAKRFL